MRDHRGVVQARLCSAFFRSERRPTQTELLKRACHNTGVKARPNGMTLQQGEGIKGDGEVNVAQVNA